MQTQGRGRRGRAPARPRAFGRGHRRRETTRSGQRGGRAVVRVSVPENIISMTDYGLRHVPADLRCDSGWWRRVVDEMQELVRSHLPPGATRVEMSLDSARVEVELSYVLLRTATAAP